MGTLSGIVASEALRGSVDSVLKISAMISDGTAHTETLMLCLALMARGGNVAAVNKIAAALRGDTDRYPV